MGSRSTGSLTRTRVRRPFSEGRRFRRRPFSLSGAACNGGVPRPPSRHRGPRAGRLGHGSRPIGATTREEGAAGAGGTRLRGNAVTVLSMATWATTFPLTDILLETWHPLPATAARLVAAVPFLWLLLALQGRLGELRRAPWAEGFRVGGLGLAGAALFIVLGIAFSDPLTVAIVAATVPLTSAVIGVAARTERLTRPVAAGLALAVAGAVVVALRGTGGGGFDLLGGEVFVVAANVCWVWYSRGCVLRLSRLSDLGKTAVTTTCAAAVVGAVVGVGLAVGLVPPRLEFSAALDRAGAVAGGGRQRRLDRPVAGRGADAGRHRRLDAPEPGAGLRGGDDRAPRRRDHRLARGGRRARRSRRRPRPAPGGAAGARRERVRGGDWAPGQARGDNRGRTAPAHPQLSPEPAPGLTRGA